MKWVFIGKTLLEPHISLKYRLYYDSHEHEEVKVYVL